MQRRLGIRQYERQTREVIAKAMFVFFKSVQRKNLQKTIILNSIGFEFRMLLCRSH